MDKFNLGVSLVARVGGHLAPRTYRDPHLCFDSDGEEDCRKVRQGENDHQSTGDGVDHEWWCVFDECVDFCKKKRRRRQRRVRVFAHWCHLVVRRRDHRHSDGALTASGWRCAASTGWRRGSSRYWCPTRSLLRRGQASLCDICQHKTRLVELSPRVGRRTGKSDVYQQPIAGLFAPTHHGTVPETAATCEDSMAPEDDHPEIELMHEKLRKRKPMKTWRTL